MACLCLSRKKCLGSYEFAESKYRCVEDPMGSEKPVSVKDPAVVRRVWVGWEKQNLYLSLHQKGICA